MSAIARRLRAREAALALEAAERTIARVRARVAADGQERPPARPQGPFGALVASLDRQAAEARDRRRLHERGTWGDGYEHGRAEVAANLASRLAALLDSLTTGE